MALGLVEVKCEYEDVENYLKTVVVKSRDRALIRQEFKRLFSQQSQDLMENEPAPSKELWGNLQTVVMLMRRKGGASLHEITKFTGLPPTNVRQCIRLVITFGGDVEVVCKDWEGANEGRFQLHN